MSCRTFPTIWRNNGRQPRLPLCSCVFLGLRHSRQSDANTQLPLLISVCVYGVISNEPPCSLPSTAVTCPDALELRSKHATIDSHSANTPSVTLGNHSVKKLNSSRRSLSHSFSHLLSDALQHPVTCPHLILSLSLSPSVGFNCHLYLFYFPCFHFLTSLVSPTSPFVSSFVCLFTCCYFLFIFFPSTSASEHLKIPGLICRCYHFLGERDHTWILRWLAVWVAAIRELKNESRRRCRHRRGPHWWYF